MATSGSFNFSLNRNQLIEQALQNLSVIGEGEAPTADQLRDGSIKLNLFLKALRAKGISLPLYQEITVYLQAGKQSYLIGPTGDEATATPQKTEVSVAGAVSDAFITVDDDSEITNADFIGVVLDNNTVQWTTVNGVPSAGVVPLTDVLTDTAAVGNFVYSYTLISQRPLTVQDARLIIDDGNHIPVKVAPREEYFDLPDKRDQGTVNLVYYDPQINNGVLYVWQPTDTVNNTLQLTTQKQIEDLDSPNDMLGLPQEWEEAVIYNLARRMLAKYGIDAETAAEIKEMARETLEIVENFDREDVYQFIPASEDDSY